MARMKSFVFIVLMLFVVADLSDASVAREPNAIAPKNPGMCFSKVYNALIKIDRLYQTPKDCGVMSCDKTYTINYSYCGFGAVEPPCTMTQDLNLPYPDCCPQPAC